MCFGRISASFTNIIATVVRRILEQLVQNLEHSEPALQLSSLPHNMGRAYSFGDGEGLYGPQPVSQGREHFYRTPLVPVGRRKPGDYRKPNNEPNHRLKPHEHVASPANDDISPARTVGPIYLQES